MFQGYSSAINISPKQSTGINLSNSEELFKIRNINNIVKTPLGTFRSRKNCINIFKLQTQETTEDIIIYDDVIKSMTYVDDNGKSSVLTYNSYFSKIKAYFQDYTNVDVEKVQNCLNYSNEKIVLVGTQGNEGRYLNATNVQIDFSSVVEDGNKPKLIEFLNRILYEDLKLAVIQSSVVRYGYISNFVLSDDLICTFSINLKYTDFDLEGQPFMFFPRRANITIFNKTSYLQRKSTYETLIDNLDSNCFVSCINYQKNLLIVNGIDQNMKFDGTAISNMQTFGDLHALTDDMVVQDERKKVIFKCKKDLREVLENSLKIGIDVTLVFLFSDAKNNKLTNFLIAEDIEDPTSLVVTLILETDVEEGKIIRQFLYESTMPIFSFITASRDRLWALQGGRSYKNKFRAGGKSMYVYYSYNRLSINRWTNPNTNQIDYIDCSSKSETPDCLEAINAYRGYLMFIGRSRTQIWEGDTPIVFDANNNISYDVAGVDAKNLFKWKSTLNVGIANQNLFVALPNDVLFLNKTGIISLNTNNNAQMLMLDYGFNDRLGIMYLADYQNLKFESDYRKACAFSYEYGNSIGFKISKDVYFLTGGLAGFLTKFSGFFSSANAISYDHLSATLFLCSKKGEVQVYNDKITNNSNDYWLIRNVDDAPDEFDENNIPWYIEYDWFPVGKTWYNDCFYIDYTNTEVSSITLTVNKDNYLEEVIDTALVAKNIGSQYGEMKWDGYLAYIDSPFTHFNKRFAADLLCFSLRGESNYMEIKNMYFAGALLNDISV